MCLIALIVLLYIYLLICLLENFGGHEPVEEGAGGYSGRAARDQEERPAGEAAAHRHTQGEEFGKRFSTGR